MAVGVWGRSPHEARRRRENFSGFYRFRHGKTARNDIKPKRNLWQFKPPGLLGLDLEASARDRRLRLCGHTILKLGGGYRPPVSRVRWLISEPPGRSTESRIAGWNVEAV